MSLGEKICALRKENDYTQAELGNALGVTYQAVSKWERDESMPDFEMISKLAKLFGVPIAHFENNAENEETVVEEQADMTAAADVAEQSAELAAEQSAPASQVLGVCTVCGKYVDSETVAVETPKLVCKTCHAKQQENARIAAQLKREHEQYMADALSSRFTKRVIIASLVAGLISIAIFVGSLVSMSTVTAELGIPTGAYVGVSIFGLIAVFTWIFQLFFDGAVRSVTLSGLFFIRLPGIIFSADLDGLIFLVVMKVIFFIISAVVFIGAIVVTSIAAMLLSLITFVPIIIKIKRGNEDLLD